MFCISVRFCPVTGGKLQITAVRRATVLCDTCTERRPRKRARQLAIVTPAKRRTAVIFCRCQHAIAKGAKLRNPVQAMVAQATATNADNAGMMLMCPGP